MKEGTKVKVIASLCGHGFDIGEIVERKFGQYEEPDCIGFYSEKNGLWYMNPDEYEIVETTVSVDWELAPVGTTHYMPKNDGFYSFWLKRDTFGWQIWDHRSERWYNGGNLNKYLDTFVIKPVEEDKEIVWDGNGLPPVGKVCEFMCTAKGKEREWRAALVKYASPFTVVLDDYSSESGKLEGEFVAHPDTMRFRPIRTPDQIAEEEREKVIQEMMHVIPPGDINSVITQGLYSVLKQVMIGLYDAGYRKEQK